ncbi:hypothetical protein D9M72_619310 [compost metagenome]
MASAMARTVRNLPPEKPVARTCSSLSDRYVTGSSAPGSSSNRPQMALALATDTCWPQITLAMPAKPRLATRGCTSPAKSRTGPRRGSISTSASIWEAMAATLSRRGDGKAKLM